MPGRRRVRLGPAFYPTTRELVLLYLLDRFEVDRDSPQADFLTQEAMMRELRISKAQVSRLVQEGTEAGHLEMGRGKPGRRKRLRTYTLSQKGRIQAEALRERMARAELRVVPPDGKEERRLLRDIPALVGRRIRYTAILMAAPDGVLHLRELAGDAPTRGLVVLGEDLVPPPRFFGRRAELQAMANFLKDSRARVLVLWGLPGIGKTTLAAKFASQHVSSVPMVLVRLTKESTPQRILKDLLGTLSEDPLPPLDAVQDVAAATARLGQLWSANRAVAILDQVEAALPECREVLAEIVTQACSGARPTLILTSRKRPELYTRAAVTREGRVVEIPIGPLDLKARREFAAAGNLPPEKIPLAVKASGGIPLMLALIAFSGRTPEGASVELKEYLTEELLRDLGRDEKDLLEALAVHTRSVPLAAMRGGSVSKVEALMKRGLAKEDGVGLYTIHDEVREIVLAQMDEKRRRSLHRQAAAHFLEEPSGDVVEATRHLLAAGETAGAGRVLLPMADTLISTGKAAELLTVVPRLVSAIEERETKSELLLAQGNCHLARGEWVKAELSFDRVRRMAPAGATRPVGEALLGLGTAALHRSDVSRGTRLLAEAVTVLETGGHLHGLVRANYYLGRALALARNRSDATKALEKARAIARGSSDIVGEGLAVLGLAAVADDEKNYVTTAVLLTEAIDLFDQAGAVREALKGRIALGGLARGQGDLDGARARLEAAVEEADRIGDLEMERVALFNLAHVVLRKGDTRAAALLMRRSRDLAGMLHNRFKAAEAMVWLGHIALLGKDAEDALGLYRSAEDLARGMDAQGRTTILLEIAETAQKAGAQQIAVSHCMKAKREARKAHSPELTGRADALLALTRKV